MTDPQPPSVTDEPAFRRRRFAPLIVMWGTALAFVAGFYWFEQTMPAFHDVVVPLYWVAGVVVVIATWRWIRARGKRDRRGVDRRRADRRVETVDQPLDKP